ncbi:hypothetical protein DL96DRAFT_1620305 [Flagelloscypha sp. PMI_526]|nr:hypothetical protein DL96DRAFT_1620305 [Flagelloscypha sp. PMI_526]
MAGKPKPKMPSSSKLKGKTKQKSTSFRTTVFLVLVPVALAALTAFYLDVPSRDRTIFDVVELEGRGKGVVARRDIEQGELIIKELPLLLVPTEISKDYLTTTYYNWTQSQKQTFLSLTYTPHEGDNITSTPTTSEELLALLEAIFRNNAVGLKLGWLGLFPRMARLNHACAGAFNVMKAELRVYAIKDIKKGEELLTTYIDSRKTREDRQKHLKSAYGFDCSLTNGYLEIRSVYNRFTRWMDGHIDGIEAIDLIHQYWSLSIAEGFWNERGQIAEEAAYVAAAHSDEEATREWSRLAYHWSTIERGSDSERAVRSKIIIANPKKHHMWGTRNQLNVGSPFEREKVKER